MPSLILAHLAQPLFFKFHLLISDRVPAAEDECRITVIGDGLGILWLGQLL
jgi:hypothetical protein